jgi:hypothetical protein
MIFATVDLANYLLGRGRYSPKSLRANSLQLATEANFAGPNEAPAGNTFFRHHRRSILSWLMMYLTHSTISHMGIHVGGGYIVDVTTAGSRIRRLEEILDGQSWLWDTRDIFAGQAPQVMDRIAARAVSSVGKKYNWFASAWVALQATTDSNYSRQPRHPRLWSDVLFCLLLPSLPALIHRRRPRRITLAPPAFYLLLLGRNEIGRYATDRVRHLQRVGRIPLIESTYWRKGEPEIRSPGDQMREMIAIRMAQLGLDPVPDTPAARSERRPSAR